MKYSGLNSNNIRNSVFIANFLIFIFLSECYKLLPDIKKLHQGIIESLFVKVDDQILKKDDQYCRDDDKVWRNDDQVWINVDRFCGNDNKVCISEDHF